MSDLDAALARISELEDQCIALGDKVLHMLPVVDAARQARRIAGVYNLHTAKCQDSPCEACDDLAEVEQDAENGLDMQLAALDALPPVPQPRQPAVAESDAAPDVQPTEPA